MFERLFQYSFDAFNIWRLSCDNGGGQRAPRSAEFFDEIVDKIRNLPVSKVGDGVDLDDKDTDYKLHVDRLNSILQKATRHVGYCITAKDLGVGSLPYLFQEFDDDPNPQDLLPERSCFYVVVCQALFNSGQSYSLLRRSVARFIKYIGYLPTNDPIWSMSIASKLYEMILNALNEMDEVDDDLKHDIKAITPPIQAPKEAFRPPPSQLTPDEFSRQSNAYMDHWWKTQAQQPSLINICAAIADYLIDHSNDTGELEILFASIILRCSFVIIQATKADKNIPDEYNVSQQNYLTPPHELLSALQQRLSSFLRGVKFWKESITQYIYVGFLSYGHYVSVDWSPSTAPIHCGITAQNAQTVADAVPPTQVLTDNEDSSDPSTTVNEIGDPSPTSLAEIVADAVPPEQVLNQHENSSDSAAGDSSLTAPAFAPTTQTTTEVDPSATDHSATHPTSTAESLTDPEASTNSMPPEHTIAPPDHHSTTAISSTLNHHATAPTTHSPNSPGFSQLSDVVVNNLMATAERDDDVLTDPELALEEVKNRYVYDIDRAIAMLEGSLQETNIQVQRTQIQKQIAQHRVERQEAILAADLELRVEAQCLLRDGIIAVSCRGTKKRSFSVVLADSSLINPKSGLPIWGVGRDFIEQNFPSVYVDAVRNKSSNGDFFVTNKAIIDATPGNGFCVTRDAANFFESLTDSDGPKKRGKTKHPSKAMIQIQDINARVKLDAALEPFVHLYVMDVFCSDNKVNNIVPVTWEFARTLGYQQPSRKDFKIAKHSIIAHMNDPTTMENHHELLYHDVVLQRVATNHNLSFKLDSQEVHAIRWCDQKKQFQGLVYAVAEMSPELRKGKPINLEESWVAANFTKEQIAIFRASGSTKRKFIQVPPGAVASDTDIPTHLLPSHNDNGQSPPKLRWTQGDEKLCLYCSVASVLHYLGCAAVGEQLYSLGLSVVGGSASHPTMPCMSRVREFVMSHYSKCWHPVRLKPIDDILRINIPDDEFAVITIRASDGAVNHCITISNNWVFDSNVCHALPLSRATLDWCSGKGSRYVCVQNGYHFVKNAIHNSKTKTRRRMKKLK